MVHPLISLLAFAVLFATASASAPDPKVVAETELIKARAEVTLLNQRLKDRAQTDEFRRLEAEAARRAALQDLSGAEGEAERLALMRTAALEAARVAAKDAAQAATRAELEVTARLAQAEANLGLIKADAGLAKLAAQRRVEGVIPGAQMEYPVEPLQNGTLRISDRRIPCNGVVSDALASFVCERIAFYNARNTTAPIFLVIDNSPGGSVMAGYQILRAMETSRAPVYVVVKGSAASMAAVITTLASRSFVYPGAWLMHHQPSFGMQGNLRQLQERFDWSKVWCDRINREVAAKMGLTLEAFVARMYASSVTGDWRVSGQEAVELRWATEVAERIQEEGITELVSATQPARVAATPPPTRPSQEILPPALPGDAWLIYNPNPTLTR